MTAIQDCTCSHEFQDKTYGKGKRVHNSIGKGKGHGKEIQCTVCLAKKENRGHKESSPKAKDNDKNK